MCSLRMLRELAVPFIGVYLLKTINDIWGEMAVSYKSGLVEALIFCAKQLVMTELDS